MPGKERRESNRHRIHKIRTQDTTRTADNVNDETLQEV